jgi:hypothetical protein
LTYRYGDPINLLVIHLDGDRAAALGIPTDGRLIADIASDICNVIKGWLGAPQHSIPPGVVITIPMQSTETWLIAGILAGGIVDLERIDQPVTRLTSAGLLERDTDGVAIKDLRRYRKLAVDLAKASARLFARSPEASRFRGKVAARCGQLSAQPTP